MQSVGHCPDFVIISVDCTTNVRVRASDYKKYQGSCRMIDGYKEHCKMSANVCKAMRES